MQQENPNAEINLLCIDRLMSSPSLVKLGPRTPENRWAEMPHPIKLHGVNVLNRLLENVAIANALSRFNYDAMPSLKSLNLSVAVL